jgi:hypothetical protein
MHTMTMYIGYGYMCDYKCHYLSPTLHSAICILQIWKEELYYAQANMIHIQSTEIFNTIFIKFQHKNEQIIYNYSL